MTAQVSGRDARGNWFSIIFRERMRPGQSRRAARRLFDEALARVLVRWLRDGCRELTVIRGKG